MSSDGASGRLLVASNGIDREELSRYSLTIRAEDAGSLSSSVLVTIRVLDVNDRTPEFMDLPYVFRVRENDLTGYVGRVHVCSIRSLLTIFISIQNFFFSFLKKL